MDLEGLSLVYRTAEGTMLNGGACTLAPPSEYDCDLYSGDDADCRYRCCSKLFVFCSSSSIANETVPKIIINNTINLFLKCSQNFGNFKP